MLARRRTLPTIAPAKPVLRLGTGSRRWALAGAVAAISICAAAPNAWAQFAFFGPGGFFDEPMPRIPPRRIVHRLQDRGYSEIDRPRFDGTAYIIVATQPNGARVRLFVDAQDGVMLGRQRLGPAPRVARTPGIGRTEDDARRDAEGLIPPADIPASRSRREARLGSDPQLRPDPSDAVPDGMNPDAKARSNAAQRRSARLTQPQKAAPAPIAPDAPTPKLDDSSSATALAAPDTKVEQGEPARRKPEIARIDGTGAVEPKTRGAGREPAPSETVKAEPSKPEAVQPSALSAEPTRAESGGTDEVDRAARSPATSPVTPAASRTPPEEKPGEQTSGQTWQEPSADAPKRNVRVIDGATLVPGTGGATSTN